MSGRALPIGAATAVALLSGCSGALDSATAWSATITSPFVDERVPFCPSIISETDGAAVGFPLDGTFAVPDGLQVQLSRDSSDDEADIHTFASVSDANFGSVGGTISTLFVTPMVFDIGPTGSVYTLEDPVVTPWGGLRQPTFPTTGVNVTRTLVGGGRQAEDKVELVYDYSLDCQTIAVTDDGGNARSCACERQTFTYVFEAKQ